MPSGVPRSIRCAIFLIPLLSTIVFASECDSLCKVKAIQQANTLDSLSDIAISKLNFQQAEELLNRSKNIRESSLGSADLELSKSLQKLGELYHQTGRDGDAEQSYWLALGIQVNVLGKEDLEVAKSLNNLASFLQQTEQYEMAENLFRSALAIREAKLGPSSPGVAISLNNLACLLSTVGKYTEAESLHHRALSIRENVGTNNPELISSLSNLAALYFTLGRYADAEPLYRRAINICTKSYGANNPATSILKGNLAGLLQRIGRNSEALTLFRTALEIDENTQGTPLTSIARDQSNLGLLLFKMGQFSEAESLYRKALHILETSQIESSSAIQINLAELLDQTKRVSESQALLLLTLAKVAKSNVPEELWIVQHHFLLHFRTSNPSLAIFYGKQAVNTIQSLRSNLKDNQQTGKSYLETVRPVYTELANLLISQGRIPEAQQVLALLKEGEWKDFTRSTDHKQSTITMSPMEARWNDSLQQALLTSNTSIDTTTSHLIKAFTNLTPDIRKADLAKLANNGELPKMLAALPVGTVLVQYSLLDTTGSVLVTMRGAKPYARSIPAGTMQINSLVNDFVVALASPSADPRPIGRKLYDILFAPISKDLDSAKTKTIMFSLDGTLRYIPMAALFDGNHYLVERYAPSQFTAYFNQGSQKPWFVAGLGNTQPAPGFVALPSVRDELHGIVREQAGDHGALPGFIRLDNLFTKDSLQAALHESATVVHLASHFNFSPMGEYESYLLLGDGNKLDLHELRTGNYDFTGVDLLTLSACQTAVVGNRNANGIEIEGMAGIAQTRGASAVLATLWPVADASTSSLMESFYREHSNNLSKADALRKVQLAMLSGKMNGQSTTSARGLIQKANNKAVEPSAAFPGWQHPYYWAPFVLMGNWL